MGKRLLIVVGTRPNFIKITQFKRVAEQSYPGKFNIKILHTGQHYDNNMAKVFFEQFELYPDYFLNIPPASPNTQMAEVMLGLEKVLSRYKPDVLIVVGDVNSTFAAALTANKMNIKIAHVESGLRSFDRSMPEEINRILTDQITDYFFVTEKSGIDNLTIEGREKRQIYFVGNTMIDTMVAFEHKIQSSHVMNNLGLSSGKFILMTIHRPATVDNEQGLLKLRDLIKFLSVRHKLVFPIHPRTVNKLKRFKLYNEYKQIPGLMLIEPMDYFSFQNLIANCSFILTDSGGIQEESTFRQVPCLTLRANTERPSTIELGTNSLVPFVVDEIKEQVTHIETGSYKKGKIPPKWDGKSTERILEVLVNAL
jgi:UDP-N-acetylglucosamine 2-epimerase (non-hydrolysing)